MTGLRECKKQTYKNVPRVMTSLLLLSAPIGISRLRFRCRFSNSRDVPQRAEELFVMASEAKILQPIVRVASVYCRIDYDLDLSNRHAIVLQTL